MIVWIFVEGEGDRIALNALLARWQAQMSASRHGVRVIPLDNKSMFLRKIGKHAAEKLKGSGSDVVVGLPDLYPNQQFSGTPYDHSDIAELSQLQQKAVVSSLVDRHGYSPSAARAVTLDRFYGSGFKHDGEVILLAAQLGLAARLGVSNLRRTWTLPAENQNQMSPPKSVVRELFQRHKRRRYSETRDPASILSTVTSINDILYDSGGNLNCPTLKTVVDWLGNKTGVHLP